MKFGSFIDNSDGSFDDVYPYESKRKYSRREHDRCVAVINQQTHPVHNWSVGGALVTADDRIFMENDHIPVTMKFKIGNEIQSVEHLAQIVRRGQGQIALQFVTPDERAKNMMQHILNDCITNQFVESQLV